MTPGAHQHIVTAAASGGDDDALTLLIREYHDRIYRFGQRVCRDSFDADDAVQEAFVALARRPDVARHGGALSWLMTSVRNACLRMLRPFLRDRGSLGERGGTEEAVSPQLDPQQILERWELAQSVHAAIAALPRPYREVVVMRDLEGLSGEETCQSLGLEPAAMKTRLHRARQQLRELLEQSNKSKKEN
jgi:RNA polymerase sigma-70 factor (ECF subfamily)